MKTHVRRLTFAAALLAVTLAPLSAQKAIDLDSATIADINAAFNAGTLTAEKLTQMCLARIQAYDRQGPRLRALITVNPKALDTARVARDFLGQDPDVDWVVDAALDAMRRAGATVVDVRLPKWLLDSKGEFYNAIRYPEFVAQIAEYLATIGPSYPKNIDQLIERATRINAPRGDGAGPNPGRWSLMKREAGSGTLSDYRYTSVRDHALPMVRAVMEGIFATEKLDAIVYPTAPRRPLLISAPPEAPGGGPGSPVNLANLTGFPDLIVPAGFTGDDLPVGLSFFGPAFSEGKLLALGYSFEQATRARRLPVHTPRLKDETITVP